MWSVLRYLRDDLRCKAWWCYESDRWPAIVKACFTDGSAAMILYRLMQGSRRWGLTPLEMVFNKINVICCNCIIGRGEEFGPGFVLIHSSGVVINGAVRGGWRSPRTPGDNRCGGSQLPGAGRPRVRRRRR